MFQRKWYLKSFAAQDTYLFVVASCMSIGNVVVSIGYLLMPSPRSIVFLLSWNVIIVTGSVM